MLEPLYGYLVLGEKLFKQPKVYAGPWNFGTKKNTVTNVLEIVKEIVKFWGKGKITFKKKQKYYEQTNLQLNIDKSMKVLNGNQNIALQKVYKLQQNGIKKF